MIINKLCFLKPRINIKNNTKALILVLFVAFGSIVIFSSISNFSVQERNNTSLLDTPALSPSKINPQIQKTVDSLLSKFTGGFLQQSNSGDPEINYFLQNPSISVGFGVSTIKMVLTINSGTENPSYIEVSETFSGSNPSTPTVSNLLNSHSTYFIKSNVGVVKQEYSILVYKNIYNNIDLEYTIKDGNLKYNFYVYPGGNPDEIQIHWNGPVELEKTSEGIQITVNTVSGKQILIDNQPIGYQNGMMIQSAMDFAMTSKTSYGFELGIYDTESLLIIDPTILLLSTLIGGSAADGGTAIALDSEENIYVTGTTISIDFPAINAFNSTFGGSGYDDIFVLKLSPSGSLIYSTYIGGSYLDVSYAITIDSKGNAYITGYTMSPNFPTSNPYNGTFGGSRDIFVLKLSASGSILSFSTFIGGSGDDYGYSISVDSAGYAYVTGQTTSSNFPIKSAINSTNNGGIDICILKLSTTSSLLIYSTYLGGTGSDFAYDIALDNSGNIFLTGYTTSSNFPTLNAFNGTYGGNEDAYVCEISASGLSLLYSTYIGGTGIDEAYSIAIDTFGYVYITGYTTSLDFPIVNAYNSTFGGLIGYGDIFVSKISVSGKALIYSTYIGGSNDDISDAIAIDGNTNVYITGYTYSTDFPTINAYNSSFSGVYDAFVLELSASGSSLVYSTYVGGSNTDMGNGLAVDSSGTAYVVGATHSTNFPVINTNNLNYININHGSYDIFVFKMAQLSATELIPDGVMVLSSNKTPSLELVWNTPSFLDSFVNYNIYRGKVSNSYSLVGSSIESHFVDTTIEAGITYYYVVTAKYLFGEGSASSEIPGILSTIPSAPVIQVVSGNRSVYITWTASSDGGSPILEYQVFRGTTTEQYSFIGVTNNLYFNDTNVNGGTMYFYVVTAINAIGKGLYSQEVSTTPYGPSSLAVITSLITTTITQPESRITTTEISTITSFGSTSSPGFEFFSIVMLILTSSVIVRMKRSKNH